MSDFCASSTIFLLKFFATVPLLIKNFVLQSLVVLPTHVNFLFCFLPNLRQRLDICFNKLKHPLPKAPRLKNENQAN